ncbi:MAG TPA: hypothetical protein VI542_02130 [Candidatus Tectomicrobia bacterium]
MGEVLVFSMPVTQENRGCHSPLQACGVEAYRDRGRVSRGQPDRGIIIKGGGVLEALARTEFLSLDKTGALTSGMLHLAHVAT